ncbi:hypothetical protein LEP1GSC047_2972 [Leptospira inadai serovar Lyme str. 10]|uniref:Uncharacterized protein n=1 Tax=Leptospira inadai serovar Lyme str. 10 TaxID=1049790 RepID=V6HAJ8_9LEPT|nr:hypothetical protein LEP1GSC047_2972 [Leptospira inadai serovar Lyme str. 10]
MPDKFRNGKNSEKRYRFADSSLEYRDGLSIKRHVFEFRLAKMS